MSWIKPSHCALMMILKPCLKILHCRLSEPVCKATVHDPESYDYTDECYYAGTDILKTYQIYRNEYDNQKDMVKSITLGVDQSLTDYGTTVNLDYKWKGVNHLTMIQFFNGGLDTITFDYNGKGTTVLMERSPD
ncbi:hypothetical protein AYY16_03470 [Morganella psychrotolerans]|nr:hypothetical protein AYY16_03470 [Morganella psychrotolerans]